MSGYLLDTHVWLWQLRGDESLSRRARRLIETSLEQCWLSPISIWETGVLRRRGRIESDVEWSDWVERCGRMLPLRSAPISEAVAVRCAEVDLDHEDPADRLIAATAIVHDLTLITADRRLLACSSVRTLHARR